MPDLNDKPLTVVPPGAKGQISRVKTREPDKLHYLAEIGLVPGAAEAALYRDPGVRAEEARSDWRRG